MAEVVALISIAAVALVHATLLRAQNDSVPAEPMAVSTSSAVSTAAMAVVVLAGTSSARHTWPGVIVVAVPTRTPPWPLPELSVTSPTVPFQLYSSIRYSATRAGVPEAMNQRIAEPLAL